MPALVSQAIEKSRHTLYFYLIDLGPHFALHFNQTKSVCWIALNYSRAIQHLLPTIISSGLIYLIRDLSYLSPEFRKSCFNIHRNKNYMLRYE
jgi:hypothetical protein